MGGLPHLACGGGIAEELQDPGDQLRGVTNLVRHPLDQEGLSHFGKIVHIRSKQNGPPIPSRFKDIVTPHRDQAPPHKDDRRQSIELAQLSHGIDDNDRRKLGIPFSELASADKRKSRLMKKHLNLGNPFRMTRCQDQDRLGSFSPDLTKRLDDETLFPPGVCSRRPRPADHS